MRRKKKSKFPAKYVLLIMTLLCAVIIGCSLKASETGPVSTAAGSVIAPMQKGVNKLGIALTNVRNHLQSKKSLETENEQLREQLADAQASLNQVQLNQEELDNLKKLYQMDQTYADYEKVAANVIGKDAGNWFSVFLIDRGSNDGISVGMYWQTEDLPVLSHRWDQIMQKSVPSLMTTAMSVQRIFPLPICVL